MPHERLRCPISDAELQRRWKLIREAMKSKGIDSLVIQNNNKWLGGYVRYLVDIPGEHAYPKTVFFPVDDEMSLIVSGGDPLPPSPPDWAIRGVKTRSRQPYFRTLNYTNHMDAELLVDYVKKRNDKRVGLINLGSMDAAFYLQVKEHLPNVEFVDMTNEFDAVKAIKSPEEIELIRAAVEVQDIIFAAVPTLIRPGVAESNIRGELVKMLFDLGGEEFLIMIGSSPRGKNTGQSHPFYQHRQIQNGDQVLIMLEVNGPGGYYAELARTWSLGAEPHPELLKAFEAAKEAQHLGASLLKPGALPMDVVNAINDFMVSKGYLADQRIVAHGQGYDLVERPGFQPGETMRLQNNMNLALHPIALTPDQSMYAFCCDNYLMTENGAERLHKTPQEIFHIPYR